MNLKNAAVKSIKASRLYHRYHCAKAYQRVLEKEGDNVGFATAFISVKPAYYNTRDKKYPLHRVERVLEKSQIKKDENYCFMYSIDKKSQCLYRNTVIENMPLDYGLVVNGSLNELKKKSEKSDTAIGRQNVELIDFLEKYIDAVCMRIKDARVVASLSGMKTSKAQNLFDALQRILFINQILWQTGHKLNGLGRLDKILDAYPVNDETEELLTQFLSVLHEYYAFKSNTLMGDTGQLIILGGIEPDGSYFCNQYTSLFMQCLKELQLPDPKLLLRVSRNTPRYVLQQAADCIVSGLGCPLLSNDDCVIPALRQFGYDGIDVSNYGVSACWEPLVIGGSLEQNNLLNIEFAKVLNDTVYDDKFISIDSFEEFFYFYKEKLAEYIKRVLRRLDEIKWESDPILTLFTEGCLESGKDISNGGAKYSDYGLLSVGLATTVNSLINLSDYIFEKHYISKTDLLKALEDDFSTHPEYVVLFSATEDKFGTASRRAIEYTQLIIDCVSDQLADYHNRLGGKVKFGLSSPDYINIGRQTDATPDGRKKGAPFSTHISCDGNNAMIDVVHFVSQLKFDGISSNGNVIDIVLQPAMAKEKEKFVDYLSGGILSGMYQAQFNILSYDQLIDAQAHPEKYPNLIVRVWGFSAYFNDLPEEYKVTIINRVKTAEGR